MTVDNVKMSVVRRLKQYREMKKSSDKQLLKYLQSRCNEFCIPFTKKEKVRDLAPRVAKEIMSRPDDDFWSIKAGYWNTYFPLYHRQKVLTL